MKRASIYLVVLLSLIATQTAFAQRGRSRPAEPAQPPPAEPDQPAQPQEGQPAQPAPPAAHPTKVEPAEWAPADSLVYVGITDVGETWDSFKKTGGYAMMADPAAAEALAGVSPLSAAITELQSRLAKMLGVPPAELKNPFDGPLTFYAAAPRGAKPEAIELGVVAGVGDAELMKTYYQAAVTRLKALGTHETVSADADTIDVFTMNESKPPTGEAAGDNEFDKLDEGQASPLAGSPEQMLKKGLDKYFSANSLPAKLAACLTADRLIVASTADHVKTVLQHEKRARTLADTDDHQALLQHLKPVGTVRFLVNLPRILDMVKGVTSGPEADELRKTFKMIGAESLGSVVGHMRVGASSYDSKIESLFLMSGQRAGLARVLSMENIPTAPPATVPAGTCIYVGCNLSATALLDEIEQMMRDVDAAWADSMQAALTRQLPTGETINYRKDFLEHLRGPLTVAFGFTRPLGPNCARLLLGLGHKDQAAVTAFLTGPAAQGLLQPRDLRGNQVFDLPGIPPFLPAGLALAPTSDRLILGTTPAVEAALNPAASEPLSATEAWRRVARVVPEQAWLTIYFDGRGLLDATSELAGKKDELAAAGTPDLSAMLLMQLTQSADSTGKGGVGKLAKYAGQAIYTVSTTPAGLQVTAVQLRPEK